MVTSAKLAICGIGAGALLAWTITAMTHSSRGTPLVPPAVDLSSAPSASGPSAHCRAITTAEPECEAAWEARRQHFFGTGGQR